MLHGRHRTYGKRRAVIVGAVLGAIVASGVALASGLALAGDPAFTPGAPGAGDPYFPLDGNGGYDVRHYQLAVTYDPDSDRLTGRARLTARATQSLSRFNLDLDELHVASVRVDGCPAAWSHDDGELTVTPAQGLPAGREFVVAVEYGGVPQPHVDNTGFLSTQDGALVVGEPHVAASWFPANDHPSDRATFRFEVSVPEGLEVVANGVLAERRTHAGWTTWVWEATNPMATYLAGMAIGELAVSEYQSDGIRYWDAIDLDLHASMAFPSTGSGFALSQQADASYKRLSRVISVPAEGAQLSFTVARDTEELWDFFFVEAHTVGGSGLDHVARCRGPRQSGSGL